MMKYKKGRFLVTNELETANYRQIAKQRRVVQYGEVDYDARQQTNGRRFQRGMMLLAKNEEQ
ncbi:MAG TPA: hypothetical protein VL461_08320 [Dictyobacter sp.]|jgi:hypothetical protein|nr:hypothetical protein [Dictyobacter sp.]